MADNLKFSMFYLSCWEVSCNLLFHKNDLTFLITFSVSLNQNLIVHHCVLGGKLPYIPKKKI